MTYLSIPWIENSLAQARDASSVNAQGFALQLAEKHEQRAILLLGELTRSRVDTGGFTVCFRSVKELFAGLSSIDLPTRLLQRALTAALALT
jgi:hypothetical protein